MPVGAIVHRLESVPSTNDAARALALEGAAHGTAVLAGEQTRGRGTKGRAWHSPAGLGLYASFILRGPGGGAVPFPHLIPLAAGLAASDAVLEASGRRDPAQVAERRRPRREEARRHPVRRPSAGRRAGTSPSSGSASTSATGRTIFPTEPPGGLDLASGSPAAAP